MRLLPFVLLLGGCPPIAEKGLPDADLDGFADGVDCNDEQATVHAGADEVCDGLDNDCDGRIDEDPINLRTYYTDVDGDHHGDPGAAVSACSAPPGTMVTAGDCDDTRGDVHPEALEVCDGVDQDCDGEVDEDAVDASTWYLDVDGDGFGDPATGVVGCTGAPGTVAEGTDCDDADATSHPGAPETDCTDPVDHNCDGSAARADADGDGWAACEDCDDADAAVRPDAVEVCDDGTDEDCDGAADDADPDVTGTTLWYPDVDGDGWGEAAGGQAACVAPAGWIATAGDCDDTSAAANAGLREVCDPAGIDEDCSGAADDADPGVDPSTWVRYARDADADGHGDPTDTVDQCDPPAGYVATADDCDDTRGSVHPDAAEVCDSADLDEDCSGAADDADPAVGGRTDWFTDGDGDGYGAGAAASQCEAPPGRVAADGDCDDTDAAVSPVGTEVCDEVDQDCDGAVDEGVTTRWYLDGDGDGYGLTATWVEACAAPSGYVADPGDCDDADAAVYPDSKSLCLPSSADTGSADGGAGDTSAGSDTADTADTGASGSATALRFVVIGDTGDGSTAQYEVGQAMVDVCAVEGCDFALLVGDNFYPGGVTSTTDPLWSSAFELPYADLDLQFRAVMGNHDWNHTQDTLYLDAQVDYSAVSAKWSMPDDYYTFVEGDTTFYGIDTWRISEGYGADQEAWLPGERAASTTTWNLVFGHHPYLSNGPHGNAEPDLQDFVDTYVCGQYDVYFCGHDHNLQWLEDSCGTAFLVSGGGHSTYPVDGTNPAWFEAESLGFLWVEIDGNTFTGVFYDETGTELYRRSFSK